MKNMTDINVVLDRSGSMGVCRQATISSFNEFLNGQKNGPDEAVISLYRFDHEYEPMYLGMDINVAPRLNDYLFVPRGSTALLDAIGRTIDGVGIRLANMAEDRRPSKVIVVIITDGQENASKEYGRRRIFDMIKHQEEKYNWTFIYLGANQDSYAEAGQLGFGYSNTLNFAPTQVGLSSSSSCLSKGVIATRSMAAGSRNKAVFSAEDQASNDALAGQYKSGPTIDTVKRATPGNVFEQLQKSVGPQVTKEVLAAKTRNQIKGPRINIRKKDLSLSK